MIESDGCTGFISELNGASWLHCCEAHDYAYASLSDKILVDIELALCVAQTGNTWIALIMLLGVTLLGWIWFPWRKKRKINK